MLHRDDPLGLIVITQPAHAWVSGCLARAWGNEQFGSFAPLEQVCLGAEQHDIGWLLWEGAPTLNRQTGYPCSFREIPTAVHVDIWAGAKHLALPFGRYAALLVSLHGTGLFNRYRNWQKSPESSRRVQAYQEQEYAFQAEIIATLQNDPHYAAYATPEAIERNRSLVAIWDLFSLTVCMGLHQKHQFEQVPTASGETTLTLTPFDNDSTRIKVEPWPFQQSHVSLLYEGRLLRQTFSDETAMRAALTSADWVTMNTTLSAV